MNDDIKRTLDFQHQKIMRQYQGDLNSEIKQLAESAKLKSDEAIKQNLILGERLALAKEETVSAKREARNSLLVSIIAVTISLLPYLIDIVKALLR